MNERTHSSIFDTSVLIPRRSAESEAGFNGHIPNIGVGCGTERAVWFRITKRLNISWHSTSLGGSIMRNERITPKRGPSCWEWCLSCIQVHRRRCPSECDLGWCWHVNEISKANRKCSSTENAAESNSALRWSLVSRAKIFFLGWSWVETRRWEAKARKQDFILHKLCSLSLDKGDVCFLI